MSETYAQTAGGEQFSAPQLILLHLWPGVLGLMINLISEPIVAGLGLPSQYSNILRWTLLIILLLGYMLYLGKKGIGKLSLKGIVLYREPIPWWQYVVFVVVLLAWAFGVIALMTPLSTYLHETVFSWVPAAASTFDTSLYSQSTLIVMVILSVILNPLYGGLVEELYYRGYLLPRMSRLGVWAPVANVVLWALTHLGEPWNMPGFIVAFLPLVFVVWWKKNIYVGMLVHTIGNLLNVLLMGAMMFGGAS